MNKVEKNANSRPRFFLNFVGHKWLLAIPVLTIGLICLVLYFSKQHGTPLYSKHFKTNGDSLNKELAQCWTPVDINSITDTTLKTQIMYGKQLIAHTASFFGPKGSVKPMSNGLNCQNCHLQAGTVPFGNNYGSVASLYPKFRARRGSVENLFQRVNDCFERSLNGEGLDTGGKEMQAIVAYINFIGSNVAKGKKAVGSGLKDLPYLNRPADTVKGRKVFETICQRCHQSSGEGIANSDKSEFIYPPLWGQRSFNDGAGMYRISNLAKYVKYNMPQGTTFLNPQLSDEEAWDVAAFVCSQPRPHKNVPKDWPDILKKPVDLPFGPYKDQFSELTHKYGPFQPIEEAIKKVSTQQK